VKYLVGCNINLIYLNQTSTTMIQELEHDGVKVIGRGAGKNIFIHLKIGTKWDIIRV